MLCLVVIQQHTVSGYEGNGGAICKMSASAQIYNVIVDQNSTHKGGALASDTVTSLPSNNHYLNNEGVDGGGLYLASTSNTIKNNIFAYHTGAAIYTADTSSSVSPTYNDWYQNSSNAGGNASFSTSSSGNITSNPSLAGYGADGIFSDDYSLSSSSALIDAGDPAILDLDGSVSDIGAFGGNLPTATVMDLVVSWIRHSVHRHFQVLQNETNSSACMKVRIWMGMVILQYRVQLHQERTVMIPVRFLQVRETCDGLDNNCNGQLRRIPSMEASGNKIGMVMVLEMPPIQAFLH